MGFKSQSLARARRQGGQLQLAGQRAVERQTCARAQGTNPSADGTHATHYSGTSTPFGHAGGEALAQGWRPTPQAEPTALVALTQREVAALADLVELALHRDNVDIAFASQLRAKLVEVIG